MMQRKKKKKKKKKKRVYKERERERERERGRKKKKKKTKETKDDDDRIKNGGDSGESGIDSCDFPLLWCWWRRINEIGVGGMGVYLLY